MKRVLLCLLIGCTVTIDDIGPAQDDGPHGAEQPFAAVAGNWNPPPDVRAAGAAEYIPYEGPPPWDGGIHCGGGLLEGTRELGDYLKATFPGSVSAYGGYACRQNTANAAETSVHGTGRAIDLFIPMDGTQADNGKGDPVANWLIVHAQEIGVQYIIWDRTDWSGDHGGDKVGTYTGPVPHIDHIHVELNHAGANRQTPWFTNPSSTPGEGGPAFVVPNQQHVLAHLADGTLRHVFWDAGTNQIYRDTWGTGLAGAPVTFVVGAQQHAFARGTSGTLEHFFWDPGANMVLHDTWGTGLAGDPTAALIGAQQHVWATDAAGNLQHWFWDPNAGVVHDTWGGGVTGRPTFMLAGGQQHVFVRGTGGSLEHFFWDPGANAVLHDTWGTGITGDPAAALIGVQQHVWAADAAGNLQHWFWDPGANAVLHDTWGGAVTGRPTVMVVPGQQHVFVRGTAGTLEHFFWDDNARTLSHDTWAAGLAGDPSALAIGAQQHVWALDAAGDVQHWFWDPGAHTVVHDTWGH